MLLSIFLSNPKPEARCAMILKHAVSSLCFRTKLACKPLPLHLLQIRIRKSVKSNMRDFKHCNNHVFSPDYSSIPPAGLWRAGSVSTGSHTGRPDRRQTAGAHSAAAAAAAPPLTSPASVWTGSPESGPWISRSPAWSSPEQTDGQEPEEADQDGRWRRSARDKEREVVLIMPAGEKSFFYYTELYGVTH